MSLDKVEETAKEYLTHLVWHRLEVVSLLYKGTLNVDVSLKVSGIKPLAQKRHHIVHRNGRDLVGEPMEISKAELVDLFAIIRNLVEGIETSVSKLGPDVDGMVNSPF